jgi:Peptidase C39 family
MPNRFTKELLIGLGAVLLITGIVFTVRDGAGTKPPKGLVKSVDLTRRIATVGTNAQALKRYVEQNSKSSEPKVQDAVSGAKIRLGYLSAEKGDWSTARVTFENAASTYHGTGRSSPDFGPLDDQAAYQAGVCLVADHRDEAAKEAFRSFIKKRPLSPLIYACQKRLARMNGGVLGPSDERLVSVAIAKQEAHIRFETSVCGPRTVEYLITSKLIVPKRNLDKTNYRSLARLCRTTNQGTTMKGLREGLDAIGVASYAYRINRQDLSRVKAPFVVLVNGHYLAVTELKSDSISTYDSTTQSLQKHALPGVDDPDFFLDAITFEPLS